MDVVVENLGPQAQHLNLNQKNQLSNMITKNISNKLLIIEFDTKKQMNIAFHRISEFYEGKNDLKGSYFTPDRFLQAYCDEDMNLDYNWDGFNIPKTILRNFYINYLKQFSGSEFNIILAADEIDEDGYIIATLKDDKITLKHELCHAYYHLYPLYKKIALDIINQIPKKTLNKLKKQLIKNHYIQDVLLDEINAYLTAFELKEWKELFPNVQPKDIRKYRQQLNANFKAFNAIKLN